MEILKQIQQVPTHIQHIKVSLVQCSFCKINKNNLDRCSRCRKSYYCNVQCQKKDYPQHKKICNPTQPIKQKIVQQVNGIDQFKNLQSVGSGNFSEIYKGISKKDQKIYAIKQIDKSKLKRLEKQADVFMQKHCLQKLKGWQYAVQIQKTFQDELSLYIQMQYPSKGQIWNISKTFGLISENLIRYYFSHIVYAISKLHNDFSIVHRDLKPENILLTQNNCIKLIDFGTAKDLSRPDLKGSGNGSRRRRVFQHFIGTPNYMAPECIHNKASEKVSDIYSLGGLFYFLKTGSPPFTGGSEYLIFNKAMNNSVYLPDEVFTKVEQDLIQKMMEKDMKLRFNIIDVMNHEYFKNIKFDQLNSYADTDKKISEQQKYLIELKQQIEKYSNLYSESFQQRTKVYQQSIKPILNEFKLKIPQNYNQKYILQKIKLIQMNVYSMLNLFNDTNMGFEQIHKKLVNQNL